jgi:alkanesulfonate monooxygenase SsuD/methylene tetrahydromethanopterin reductase-like flavin-dependent oxidoreductase (luciferase family)
MRFGVLMLPNRPWPELVQASRSLDALQGLDSLWVADHLANPYRRAQPWFDGWTCLTAMAQATRRVRVGTLVSPMTFHNPARLVKAAVTLDHLSGGRIELAVGSGGSEFDTELAGVSPSRHAFEPFVVRVAQLLARDDLQPRPVQERIPLTVGGNSDAILGVAARHADRWNTYVGSRLSASEGRRLTRERSSRLQELCRETGRTVLRSALIGHSFVAETPFRSHEAFDEFVAAYEEAGIDELILYWPPEFAMPEGSVQPGLFEKLFS